MEEVSEDPAYAFPAMTGNAVLKITPPAPPPPPEVPQL